MIHVSQRKLCKQTDGCTLIDSENDTDSIDIRKTRAVRRSSACFTHLHKLNIPLAEIISSMMVICYQKNVSLLQQRDTNQYENTWSM